MQLCKMLWQESSGTKPQSSAIGNQLDTRERTMKKMWQTVSLLIFTYWCRGVSLHTPHKILETKKLWQITRRHSTFTQLLETSDYQTPSQIIACNFRLRKNLQFRQIVTLGQLFGQIHSRAARTPSSFDVWEFDCSEQLSNILRQRWARWKITSKLWQTASVDDLLVLLRPRPEHLDQLVDGSGGDERADDPPPLLWTLCSFTVLQSHPHNLEVS